MYLVREVFIAKPGHAGELAEYMKAEMEKWKGFKGHVLLDAVTNYNKVVIEYELKDMAAFDAMMGEYRAASAKAKAKGKPKPKHVEMYLTGKREVYRIVK